MDAMQDLAREMARGQSLQARNVDPIQQIIMRLLDQGGVQSSRVEPQYYPTTQSRNLIPLPRYPRGVDPFVVDDTERVLRATNQRRRLAGADAAFEDYLSVLFPSIKARVPDIPMLPSGIGMQDFSKGPQ